MASLKKTVISKGLENELYMVAAEPPSEIAISKNTVVNFEGMNI